ncbi:hypothetical protein VTN00DRAFT_3868 [Thermoascus crustaceus]|uniref:uncharacterized protein n=1 Tax=Thermoascus crustaceus TaxID=5088 RepID=UPI003743FE4A
MYGMRVLKSIVPDARETEMRSTPGGYPGSYPVIMTYPIPSFTFLCLFHLLPLVFSCLVSPSFLQFAFAFRSSLSFPTCIYKLIIITHRSTRALFSVDNDRYAITGLNFYIHFPRRHKQPNKDGLLAIHGPVPGVTVQKKGIPQTTRNRAPHELPKRGISDTFHRRRVSNRARPTLAPQNSNASIEKAEVQVAAEQQASRREMVRHHVRRMSAKITPPFPPTT